MPAPPRPRRPRGSVRTTPKPREGAEAGGGRRRRRPASSRPATAKAPKAAAKPSPPRVAAKPKPGGAASPRPLQPSRRPPPSPRPLRSRRRAPSPRPLRTPRPRRSPRRSCARSVRRCASPTKRPSARWTSPARSCVTGGASGSAARSSTGSPTRREGIVVADLDQEARPTSRPIWTTRSPSAATSAIRARRRPDLRRRAVVRPRRSLLRERGRGRRRPRLAADWDLALNVNVRAHIAAAQRPHPSAGLTRKSATSHTASAAGIASQIGSAPYAVTKHAAVRSRSG